MEYKTEYKSMNEIKIYIGSDNATNKITKEYQTKIENFFNQFIETKDINGYTLTKGIGQEAILITETPIIGVVI